MEDTNSELASRSNEARFLLKRCFKNPIFSLVPFEVWRDLVVCNAEAHSMALISQTCWGFKEIFDDIGSKNFDLALMLRKEGQIDLARKFLLKCAYNGNAKAMFYLGFSLEESGFGLKRNYEMAFRWYEISAELGNAHAITHFSIWLRCPYPFEIEGNEELYKIWSQKAWCSNNSFAMGYHCLKHWNKLHECFPYFKASANEGDEFGQYYLGLCYLCGYGCGRDMKKYFRWTLKSAEQGFCLAMGSIEDAYRRGLGCEKNEEMAEIWSKKLQKQILK